MQELHNAFQKLQRWIDNKRSDHGLQDVERFSLRYCPWQAPFVQQVKQV